MTFCECLWQLILANPVFAGEFAKINCHTRAVLHGCSVRTGRGGAFRIDPTTRRRSSRPERPVLAMNEKESISPSATRSPRVFPLALMLAASGPAQPPVSVPSPVVQPPSVSLPPPSPLSPTHVKMPTGTGMTVAAKTTNGTASAAAKPALPSLSLEDCLRACPPANDPAPFLRLPKVSVVEECQTAAGDGKCDPACVWKHTWHTAAKFTVPRFDLAGEPMEGDALVIYEGMTLAVNQLTGVYDLSFTATHPPTPVLLRLQLAFAQQPEGKAEPVRLTLPPIRFDVEDIGTSGDTSGRTVRVHHRGQSDLFLKSDGIPNPMRTTDLIPGFFIDESARVVRLGTARFGSARISSGELDR